jgi:putative ABC transport system permease protein
MGWLRFLKRSRRDADCAREIESYLAIETDDNVARGMSLQDARDAAIRKFGNPTRVREEVYAMHSIGPADSLWQDVRYAIRVLAREKAFAAAALLSLTLGIGANTAIFQLLEAVRLRPLPVAAAEELAEVRIGGRASRTGSFNGRRPEFTYAMWSELVARQQAFVSLFAWSSRRFNTAPTGEVHFVEGLFVSGNYFEQLRVPPIVGRVFTSADDRRGCGPIGAVISYAYWQRAHGGDPSALNKTISLDGHAFPIVGVTPPWFFGMEVGRMYDVAVPLCTDDVFAAGRGRFERRDSWWLATAGRLAPGWTTERASEHLAALSPDLFAATLPLNYAAEDAKSYRAFNLNAFPASTGVSSLRTNFAEPLTLLLATTGLVLLIACANLANLLLARASARSREIAVRLAIGASRRRVVRQLLVESSVLAAAGGVAGALLAGVLTSVLVGVLAGDNHAFFVDLSWNVRLLGFTVGVAFVACLLFGVVPAIRATALAPATALKSGGRGLTASRERFGLRRALVVAQVAFSLVLLLGALLFSRTLYNLRSTDPGFAHDSLVVAMVTHLSRLGDTTGAPAQLLRRQLLERLELIPEVGAVAQADVVPLSTSGFWNESVFIDGAPTRERRIANFNRVSGDYFSVLNVPFVAGRGFDDRDTLESPDVAIVSQKFVTQYLGGQSALGRRVRVETGPGGPELVYEIVGVVTDTLVTGLRDEIIPMVYVANTQEDEPGNGSQFVIRPRRSIAELLPAVTREVGRFGPALNLEFRVLNTMIRDSLVRERLMATLSSVFGVLAGLLAAIGLYGVMSYTVICRANEIGIRMAMGAPRSAVLRMVLREAGVLVAVGLVLGLILAVAAAGSARALLFGLDPTDPTTLVLACGLLAVIGFVAGLVPALRASRLDPSSALRTD